MSLNYKLILIGIIMLSSCKNKSISINPPHEPSDHHFGWTTSTRKILQDKVPNFILRQDSIKISAAKNEYEMFQLVISAGSEPLDGVIVEMTDLVSSSATITKEHIKMYVPHYVYIPSSYNSPQIDSGWYPDALVPIERNAPSVKSGENTSVWVSVFVPKNVIPGIYTGTVRLKKDNYVLCSFPVKLTVWDFALPNKSSQETAFGVWYDHVAQAHGYLGTKAPGFQTLGWSYYWYLIQHRITPIEIPDDYFSAKWWEAVRDERVSSFRLPWPSTKENKSQVAKLRAEGLLSKGYVYTYDELQRSEFSKAIAIGDSVHREYGNDARVIFTGGPIPLDTLIGAVDIWVPQLNHVSYVQGFNRQLLGERLWWYTMVVPKAPYPTYFIDDDAISPRMLSWLQVLNKIDGTLYWSTTVFQRWDGTNYVSRDVWNEPEAYPKTYGDGYLLYPGDKYSIHGPIGTVRLEMIREGNEDFEYFTILREKLKASGFSEQATDSKISELISPVATNLMNWTKDPDVLYKQREKVATEILKIK